MLVFKELTIYRKKFKLIKKVHHEGIFHDEPFLQKLEILLKL